MACSQDDCSGNRLRAANLCEPRIMPRGTALCQSEPRIICVCVCVCVTLHVQSKAMAMESSYYL